MIGVTVESPNEITVNLLNPFIPASVEVAGVGIQGPRGYAVLSGNGSPSPFEGINNDLYVDLDIGYLYKKIADVWEFQLTISPQKETFVIDAGIRSAKKVTLNVPPRPDAVGVSFIGGLEQENDGTAFYISGNEIKWDGISPISGSPYDFQSLLADGDVMVVTY